MTICTGGRQKRILSRISPPGTYSPEKRGPNRVRGLHQFVDFKSNFLNFKTLRLYLNTYRKDTLFYLLHSAELELVSSVLLFI